MNRHKLIKTNVELSKKKEKKPKHTLSKKQEIIIILLVWVVSVSLIALMRIATGYLRRPTADWKSCGSEEFGVVLIVISYIFWIGTISVILWNFVRQFYIKSRILRNVFFCSGVVLFFFHLMLYHWEFGAVPSVNSYVREYWHILEAIEHSGLTPILPCIGIALSLRKESKNA